MESDHATPMRFQTRLGQRPTHLVKLKKTAQLTKGYLLDSSGNRISSSFPIYGLNVSRILCSKEMDSFFLGEEMLGGSWQFLNSGY